MPRRPPARRPQSRPGFVRWSDPRRLRRRVPTRPTTRSRGPACPIDGCPRAHYPHTTIDASELHVGLPAGQMGNSEVGHLNIGAGRVVYQDLTRIDQAIARPASSTSNPVLGDAHGGGAARRAGAAHARPALARRRAQPRAAHRRAGRPGGARGVAASSSTPSSTAATRRRAARRPRSRSWTTPAPRRHARGATARIAIDLRSLLRDGSGQALGARRTRVRACWSTAGAPFTAPSARAGLEAAYARGENDEFVQATAILDATGHAGAHGGRRRRRVHELPRRPRAADHPRAHRRAFDGFARARVPALARYVCLTSYGEEFAHLPVAYAPQTHGRTASARCWPGAASRSFASRRRRSTRT